MTGGLLDLDAPIVPGQSAAGITLGLRLEVLLTRDGDQFTSIGSDRWKYVDWEVGSYVVDQPVYQAPGVRVRVDCGLVTEIVVETGYRGLTSEGIGVGSTCQDIEARAGNLIPNLFETAWLCWPRPGVWFEIVDYGRDQNPVPDLWTRPVGLIGITNEMDDWEARARTALPPPLPVFADVLRLSPTDPFYQVLAQHHILVYRGALYGNDLHQHPALVDTVRAFARARMVGIADQLQGRALTTWLLQEALHGQIGDLPPDPMPDGINLSPFEPLSKVPALFPSKRRRSSNPC